MLVEPSSCGCQHVAQGCFGAGQEGGGGGGGEMPGAGGNADNGESELHVNLHDRGGR